MAIESHPTPQGHVVVLSDGTVRIVRHMGALGVVIVDLSRTELGVLLGALRTQLQEIS